jgi:hypothetical protein
MVEKEKGEELTGKTSTVKEIWGSWTSAKYETAFSSRWQRRWRSGGVGNFLQRRREMAGD